MKKVGELFGGQVAQLGGAAERAQKVTLQMSRMGAEEPAILFHHPARA